MLVSDLKTDQICSVISHRLSVDQGSRWRDDIYFKMGQWLWESYCLPSWLKPVFLHLPQSNISISYMLSLDPGNQQRSCCLHLDAALPQGMICFLALPSSMLSISLFTEQTSQSLQGDHCQS